MAQCWCICRVDAVRATQRGTAVEWPPFPPMAELTVAFYKVGHALRHDLQRTVHGAFLSHTKVAA